jgi:hypothetical protein
MLGTPTRAGVFQFGVTVTDSLGTRAQGSTVITVVAPLSITQTSLSPARTNNSYSDTLRATGGFPPYNWNISANNLPAGLSLSPSGEISGTVNAAPGQYSFTAAATDARGDTSSGVFTITVIGPSISTRSLPPGQAGAAYSQTLAATGGSPPYAWTVVGSLPGGLSLDRGGLLSGVPAAAGEFAFTLRVTDSQGSFASLAYTLTIGAAQLLFSTQTLSACRVGSPYSAPLAAAGGTPPYQFALDSGSLPDGIGISSAGAISGTPAQKGTW